MCLLCFFVFDESATTKTEPYGHTLSLHDALPNSFQVESIKRWAVLPRIDGETKAGTRTEMEVWRRGKTVTLSVKVGELTNAAATSTEKAPDRKSTRINSSH